MCRGVRFRKESASEESASESENTFSESVRQNQPSTSTGATNSENTIDILPSLPHPSYNPLPSDSDKWPVILSDAQRVDMVKRGSYQVVTNFPYNAAKRRFSSRHCKRVCLAERLLLDHGWHILKIPLTHFAFATNFLATQPVHLKAA